MADSAPGFAGRHLARNVATRPTSIAVMAEAAAAGAHILRRRTKTFWGGYSGYFADPDGHLWEVAHNPFWPLDAHGQPQLPPPAKSVIGGPDGVRTAEPYRSRIYCDDASTVRAHPLRLYICLLGGPIPASGTTRASARAAVSNRGVTIRDNRTPSAPRKSWGYQLSNLDVAALAASAYDVLVIDYSRDGSRCERFDCR